MASSIPNVQPPHYVTGGTGTSNGGDMVSSMLTALMMSSSTRRSFGVKEALRMSATNWAMTRGIPMVDRIVSWGVKVASDAVSCKFIPHVIPRISEVVKAPLPPSTLVITASSGKMGLVLPILWYISEKTSCARNLILLSTRILVPHNLTDAEIAPGILCSVRSEAANSTTIEDDGTSKSITSMNYVVTLKSTIKSAIELKAFVDHLSDEHLEATKNMLGNHIWIFDQVVTDASRKPYFNKHRFFSTRTLDNMFLNGDAMEKLRTQLHHFLNNKKWYLKTGVPMALGILLTGPPGTGKTSLIKALANETRRHLVNVRLDLIKTKDALESIFLDDDIPVGSYCHETNVPTDKRIFVIEDVDCAGCEMLKRRSTQAQVETAQIQHTSSYYSDYTRKPREPQVTLSDLLNVLDGIREPRGRIIVMSTNHPEALDPALIRPGRFDLHLHLDHADSIALAGMVDAYCEADTSMLDDDDRAMLDASSSVLTPAEASAIILRTGVSKRKNVIAAIHAESDNKKRQKLASEVTQGDGDIPSPNSNGTDV